MTDDGRLPARGGRRGSTDDPTTDRGTLGSVDHTHPYDDEGFGDLFRRGPAVVADGGRRGAGDEDEPRRHGRSDGKARPVDGHRPADVPNNAENAGRARDRGQTPETMKDVSHTPPEGDGANRVFERGPPDVSAAGPVVPTEPDDEDHEDDER